MILIGNLLQFLLHALQIQFTVTEIKAFGCEDYFLGVFRSSRLLRKQFRHLSVFELKCVFQIVHIYRLEWWLLSFLSSCVFVVIHLKIDLLASFTD